MKCKCCEIPINSNVTLTGEAYCDSCRSETKITEYSNYVGFTEYEGKWFHVFIPYEPRTCTCGQVATRTFISCSEGYVLDLSLIMENVNEAKQYTI